MRLRIGLAVAFASALAVAGVASGSGTAGPCSLKAAAAAVVASNLSDHWKEEARHVYGPNEGLESVACRDFTRDGKTDMEATFFSGGTAGDVAWVVFRRVGNDWKLALARLKDYKLSLAFHGADIVETQPVYKPGDANCCPTGGFDHRQFRWNGSKFVIARFWHNKTYKA